MAFWMESLLKVRRVEEAVEHVSSEVGLVDGRGEILRWSCCPCIQCRQGGDSRQNGGELMERWQWYL
jgi:hypothetical protein